MFNVILPDMFLEHEKNKNGAVFDILFSVKFIIYSKKNDIFIINKQ